MPSEKVLLEKQQIVVDLTQKLKKATAGVLVDYKGITVANDTKLRKELRQAGIDYAVVKNTLLRFAAKEAGYDDLTTILGGTTALAISDSDPVIAAKLLCKYADSSKGKFTIKAGFVEGKAINAAEVDSLAKLPPREQLVAMALGGLNAPITSFVTVLNANIRGLAVALNAIAEQKGA